jgi:hypothetical protein
VYSPSRHWAYSSAIAAPAQLTMVAKRLRARGLPVDLVGTPQAPEGTAPEHD